MQDVTEPQQEVEFFLSNQKFTVQLLPMQWQVIKRFNNIKHRIYKIKNKKKVCNYIKRKKKTISKNQIGFL